MEAFEFLTNYARRDWLDLSIVVDYANRITGAGTKDPEIAEMTLRLVSDLLDEEAQPGNLDYGPVFVPWPGTKEEQLARIAKEMNELGKLPYPGDICCFCIPDINNMNELELKRFIEGS